MKIKKLLTPVLAAVMLLSACGGQTPTINNASLSDVTFWSTYSTEKVIQNNVKMYESIRRAPKIDVTAIRGEEEAAQIIMSTGEKPVVGYDVALSDLTGDNGQTFAKENIKVYHELYIEVGAASEYYTTAGFYPDALAPFAGVKAAKENNIKKNSNQGLYVSFDVPETQPAGIYTGNMYISIDGEAKVIPITLEVAAVTIGKETHVASSFLNEWYFYRGELDTTEEMYDKYNKFLFDYRLGCNNVTVYNQDVNFYAEKVCEYAALDECPGYNIPWFAKNYSANSVELNGRLITGKHAYDIDKMLLYFRTIADKGLETGVDPFKKAFVYGWDEPDLTFGTQKAAIYVKEWSYIVKQCKKIVMQELEERQVASDKVDLKAQIIKSLDDMPHLVLSNKFLNMEIDLDEEEISYGPYFSALGSEGSRDRYRLEEDNPLWWYGCTAPRSPYPTYHIDDTVLSARLESWMKADYNIQGNLYWSTCLYSAPSVQDAMIYPEDFYTGNAARSLGVYGEGFLLYPGKKYQVDGPIPSVRIEQIRDGLEEYEMIYSLKQIYSEVSSSIGVEFDEDSFMQYLYTQMYSGAKVSTTPETFEQVRATLINLTQLAQSSAKVCVMNANEGAGAYEYQVFVKDGYELKQAGEIVTAKRTVNGGNVYTVNVTLGEGNKLDLSVEVDGRVLGLEMNLGSGSIVYNAEYAFNNQMITERFIEVSTELVDGKSVNTQAADGEKYVKIALGAAEGAIHDFLIVGDVIENISSEDDKLVIRIYNPGAPVDVEIMTRNGNDKKYISKEKLSLQTGMNSLSLNNLYGYNWSKIKYIENVRIRLGADGDAATSVYFVDMSLFKR